MSRSLLLRFYFQLVARRPGSVIPGNQNNDWKGGTGESTAGLFTKLQRYYFGNLPVV